MTGPTHREADEYEELERQQRKECGPPLLDMHNPDQQIGRAVILKPGDIAVLETDRHMTANMMADLRASLHNACELLGIKILVLPHGCKVARVWVDDKEKVPA